MRQLHMFLSLAPAPLFALGLVWSFFDIYTGHSHSWQMSVMWFVMALAHVTPWIIWRQQRDLAR